MKINMLKGKKKSLNNLVLGKNTTYKFDKPDFKILESVPNPHSDIDYVVRFTSVEFTSLCPITSQPDFARLIIDYTPNQFLIESKSLKLYLFSFRNHGAFHEDCTIKIAKDLIKLVKPKWLRITGLWFPRGGIPIDIFYQTSTPPKNIYISEISDQQYQPR